VPECGVGPHQGKPASLTGLTSIGNSSRQPADGLFTLCSAVCLGLAASHSAMQSWGPHWPHLTALQPVWTGPACAGQVSVALCALHEYVLTTLPSAMQALFVTRHCSEWRPCTWHTDSGRTVVDSGSAVLIVAALFIFKAALFISRSTVYFEEHCLF
jgi:hypothetical protein